MNDGPTRRVLGGAAASVAAVPFPAAATPQRPEPIGGEAGIVLNVNGHDRPMQEPFIDHDAFQCGYCTSGQIMSAIACVEQGHAGSAAAIREFMSGNLCRCAAYPNIVAAILQARDAMKT